MNSLVHRREEGEIDEHRSCSVYRIIHWCLFLTISCLLDVLGRLSVDAALGLLGLEMGLTNLGLPHCSLHSVQHSRQVTCRDNPVNGPEWKSLPRTQWVTTTKSKTKSKEGINKQSTPTCCPAYCYCLDWHIHTQWSLIKMELVSCTRRYLNVNIVRHSRGILTVKLGRQNHLNIIQANLPGYHFIHVIVQRNMSKCTTLKFTSLLNTDFKFKSLRKNDSLVTEVSQCITEVR
jgi:hypothetical protein